MEAKRFESDKWLTINEAAKLSGYHPEYVRRLLRQGKIRGKKFSIVWMVDHKSLLEYMESQKSRED
jgi:excisionase family DNA binding protein